jgi:probable rRNA maturation factor
VAVFVANEQTLPVDEVRVSTLGRHTLAAEELDDGVELSVLFVTSEHIRELNSRFAGNDYATDVLAFPLTENNGGATVLGDVVICPQIAEENARRLGHDLVQELDTLLVHGTLHLLGYDHENEADRSRMQARQQSVLDSFQPSRS